MRVEKTDLFTIIHPDEGYKLSNLDKTEMCEGSVYLGIYDSPDNYTEVTIEEYNNWLKENNNKMEATADNAYNEVSEYADIIK